jgi:predicted CoA-binding protein
MAASRKVAEQIIATCRSVLLVDWRSPEVPATLTRAGWIVYVNGWPGQRDFSRWELVDGSPLSRETGRRPAPIDLVYVHRPLEELPGIIVMPQEMGARALWYESGSAPSESLPRGRWSKRRDCCMSTITTSSRPSAPVDTRLLFRVTLASSGPTGRIQQ